MEDELTSFYFLLLLVLMWGTLIVFVTAFFHAVGSSVKRCSRQTQGIVMQKIGVEGQFKE
jgi:hypothetical protein